MEISHPSLLAKLAHAPAADGKLHFGDVWEIKQGVKRKRQEICVAVDGDSISLFEIQNGAILSSYPIPSTARCQCSPHSIRVKLKQSNLRYTYCAVEDYNLQLRCFTEDTGQATIRKSEQKAVELNSSDGSVIHVGSSAGGNPEIVVVQQDGLMSRFSHDTLTQKSQARLQQTTGNDPIQPIEVRLLSVHEARRFVLKQRGDIGNTLSQSSTLLACVYRSKPSIEENNKMVLSYGLWQLETQPGPGASPLALKPLLSHRLYHDALDISEDSTASFDRQATSITVDTQRKRVIWDITYLLPTVIGDLTQSVGDSHSTLSLTTQIAISATSRSIQLLDTKFQAQLSHLDLSSLKRKRNNSVTDAGSIRLIGFFPRLNRVLALRRSHLIAVDITFSSDGNRRALKTPSLSDSVGQGIMTQSSRTKQARELPNIGAIEDVDESPQDGWKAFRSKLEEVIKNNDQGGLESLLFNSDTTQPQSWSHTKCTFVLQKMFTLDLAANAPDREGSNKVRKLNFNFYSRKSIEMLIRTGSLNLQTLQKALVADNQLSLGQQLAPSAISAALKDADPSLAMLTDYLELTPRLPIEEASETIKLLLQHALSQGSHINGDTRSQSEDQLMIDAHEAEAVQPNVTLAEQASGAESLPPNLTTCLNAGLQRFGQFTPRSLSKQIRASFSQTESLALIQYLRQQLFRAGHTGPMQAHEHLTNGSDPVKLPFEYITKIMSSCIDAIGPLGFVVSEVEDDFTEKVISDLQSEITQATIAVEEVSFLQGILRETLRFSESMRDPLAVSRPKAETEQKLQIGRIMTLYSEDQDDGDMELSNNALPLSLRNENSISSTKVRKVGGQVSKRSGRAIAMLEHRHKGLYSFERLVL